MTLVLAHRGANREAPENTVRAFARALEIGADGVELDVHRTADHALVVRHDPGGPGGLLSEMTLAEVRERMPEVPTLGEALDACAGRLVNVEIKNVPQLAGFDPAERVGGLVVELLHERGRRDDVLVSSFHLATVDRVRNLDPELDTGFLAFGTDPFHALDVARAHGHRAVHPDVASLPGPIAAAVVARAHECEMRVNVWTVNEPAEVARLARGGVDAVITDLPGVALEVLRERRG